jgi:hypothetical protein
VAALKYQEASQDAKTFGKKHTNLKHWSKKITETKKFEIARGISAFDTVGSRYNYIRILVYCFVSSPEFVDVSLEELFNPANEYAKFQRLLDACPVPAVHRGFYLRIPDKDQMVSPYLSSP